MEPHQGTSYNPPVDAHTELILKADDLEQRREKEAERLKEIKARISGAVGSVGGTQDGVPEGMALDEAIEDDETQGEGEGDDVDGPSVKKAPTRKTKQQRTKAARQRAEVCSIFPTITFTTKDAPCHRNALWPKNYTTSGC